MLGLVCCLAQGPVHYYCNLAATATTGRIGRNLDTFYCRDTGTLKAAQTPLGLQLVAYTNYVCIIGFPYPVFHFNVPFPPLQYCSAFSFLAFCTPAKCSRIFLFRNFISRIFSVPQFSDPRLRHKNDWIAFCRKLDHTWFASSKVEFLNK